MLMNPDLLRTSPLLAELSNTELDHIAMAFQRQSFPAGEILFQEGDPGEGFSILLRGEIEIIKSLGKAEERLLSVIGPGGFLGEMSLLGANRLRSASARARGKVEWALLTPLAFEELMQRQPSLSLHLVREMNNRLRRSEADMINDLQAKNQALTLAYRDLERAQAALVEKEKLEHELKIARVIQESILPKQIPSLPGWQMAAYWQPATAVSGDFYDFLSHLDERLGLLIADVSGKGVPAAMVMAVTCSILRAVAKSDISPGTVLERANDLLCSYIPSGMFTTCLYGVLDPAQRTFRFANAGHNLPLLVADRRIQELRATGMPLGLMPGMTYEESEIHLQPGSGLLLFTDGIVEAHNSKREMFGSARLKDCIAEIPFGAGIIHHLPARLAAFTGPDVEQEDDVTLVALVCQPSGST